MTPETLSIATIAISSILALLWAILNNIIIVNTELTEKPTPAIDSIKKESLLTTDTNKKETLSKIADIGSKISQGASAFLLAEYSIMIVFVVLFSIVVFLIVDLFGTV